MSREELLALPVTVDVVTAGRPFGISRAHAYELARLGEFPVRVMRIGHRYRVVTQELIDALGVGTTDKTPGALQRAEGPSEHHLTAGLAPQATATRGAE